VIEGRAACRLARNISFKTFIEGSYFGDLELLTQKQRLFSVQATESLKLAVIEREKLMQILASDPIVSSNLVSKTLKRYIHIKNGIRRIRPYKKITMNSEFWDASMPDGPSVNEKIDLWLELIRGVINSNRYSRTPEAPNKKRKKTLPIISRVTRISGAKKNKSQLTGCITPSLLGFSCQDANQQPQWSNTKSSIKSQVLDASEKTGFFEELKASIAELSRRIGQLEATHSELAEKHRSVAAAAAKCACGAFAPASHQPPKAAAARRMHLSRLNLPELSSIDQSPASQPQSLKVSKFASPKLLLETFLKPPPDLTSSLPAPRLRAFSPQRLGDILGDLAATALSVIDSQQQDSADPIELPQSPLPIKNQLSHPQQQSRKNPFRIDVTHRSIEFLDDSDIAEEWPCRAGMAFPPRYFEP